MGGNLRSPDKNLVIHTDGGARGNPGPAAAACVIKDLAGNVRVLRGKYLGKGTNNFAEYQGVILAYEELLKIPHLNFLDTTLDFNLDSNLVVNQLNGLFKVKDKNIRELVVKIRNFEPEFSQVHYHYIPRDQNKLADQLVNKTLDKNLT